MVFLFEVDMVFLLNMGMVIPFETSMVISLIKDMVKVLDFSKAGRWRRTKGSPHLLAKKKQAFSKAPKRQLCQSLAERHRQTLKLYCAASLPLLTIKKKR
jgi:hypothetical protein